MKYDYEPLMEDSFYYDYPLELYKYNEKSRTISYDTYMNGRVFRFDDWDEVEREKLAKIFEIDYDIITESEIYFYGCGSHVYKNTYTERLSSFLTEFPDANEIDFCEYELQNEVKYITSEKLGKKIGFSIKKRNEFLNNKKTQLIVQPLQTETFTQPEKSLNWQGTNLEFTELIKALYESNKLNPELKQNEIFKRLKQFFNVAEFNENDKLKDIRKRTHTTTPLLNILETSLNNWIKNKD